MSDLEIGDAFVQIANMLDVRVQYIYEVFVKAQFYIGVMDLIILIICCGIFCASVIWAYKYGDVRDVEDCFAFSILSMMVVLIIASILLIVKNCVLTILCPEYMAIREILSLIGG